VVAARDLNNWCYFYVGDDLFAAFCVGDWSDTVNSHRYCGGRLDKVRDRIAKDEVVRAVVMNCDGQERALVGEEELRTSSELSEWMKRYLVR
jgi:hypothetical protein